MNFFRFVIIAFAVCVPELSVASVAPANCTNDKVEQCRVDSNKSCRPLIGSYCAEIGLGELKARRYVEAKRFLNRSCRLEVGASCYLLGKMELESGNAHRAKVYFLSGCQFDSDDSCEQLIGMAAKTGKVDTPPASNKEPDHKVNMLAKGWVDSQFGTTEPCAAISPESCFKEGVQALKEKDLAKATAFLQSACDNKFAEACNRLGWTFQQKSDWQQSESLYRKGCKLKLAKSCNNVAWLHEMRNQMVDAAQFYKQACDLEHRSACKRIAVIKN